MLSLLFSLFLCNAAKADVCFENNCIGSRVTTHVNVSSMWYDIKIDSAKVFLSQDSILTSVRLNLDTTNTDKIVEILSKRIGPVSLAGTSEDTIFQHRFYAWLSVEGTQFFLIDNVPIKSNLTEEKFLFIRRKK